MPVETAVALLKMHNPHITFDPDCNQVNIAHSITMYQTWEIASILQSQADTIKKLQEALNNGK